MDLAQGAALLGVAEDEPSARFHCALFLRAHRKYLLVPGLHIEDGKKKLTGCEAESIGSRWDGMGAHGERKRNAGCNRKIGLFLQVPGEGSAADEKSDERCDDQRRDAVHKLSSIRG